MSTREKLKATIARKFGGTEGRSIADAIDRLAASHAGGEAADDSRIAALEATVAELTRQSREGYELLARRIDELSANKVG